MWWPLLNVRVVLGPHSDSQWVFVFGHYPVVSGGEGGDVMLPTALNELLERYRVSAYISSHDHSLQHLVYNGIN